MARPFTKGVVGMGVSAAMWAAVVLGPTNLSREAPPPAPPEADGLPARLAGTFHQIDDLLAYRLPRLDVDVRGRLAGAVVREADAAKIDPFLVLAVIEVESRFTMDAASGAGAVGLMQLHEESWRTLLKREGLSEDLRDPVTNVRLGVRYLRRLMDQFPREDVALMAYNAGPVRILQYLRAGEIPDRFHVYPRRVNAELRRLRRQPAAERAPELAAAHRPASAAAAPVPPLAD